MELLFSEGLIATTRRTMSELLVTVYDEAQRATCNSIAFELRSHGIPTEVYFKTPKVGKQIEYSEQKGIRYVLFLDAESQGMRVKDLVAKEQVEVSSVQALVDRILQDR